MLYKYTGGERTPHYSNHNLPIHASVSRVPFSLGKGARPSPRIDRLTSEGPGLVAEISYSGPCDWTNAASLIRQTSSRERARKKGLGYLLAWLLSEQLRARASACLCVCI